MEKQKHNYLKTRIKDKENVPLRYYNGTKHQVNFYTRAQTYRAGNCFSPFEGEKPVLTLPVQRCLSVHFYQQEYLNELGIPVKHKRPVHIDELPEGYDIYIVSSAYAAHCDDERIRIIDSPLFDGDGMLVGCLGLKQELRGVELNSDYEPDTNK